MLIGSVLEEQIYKSEISSTLAWVLCEQLRAHTHTHRALLRNRKLEPGCSSSFAAVAYLGNCYLGKSFRLHLWQTEYNTFLFFS